MLTLESESSLSSHLVTVLRESVDEPSMPSESIRVIPESVQEASSSFLVLRLTGYVTVRRERLEFVLPMIRVRRRGKTIGEQEGESDEEVDGAREAGDELMDRKGILIWERTQQRSRESTKSCCS
jgi:hypothetical protein